MVNNKIEPFVAGKGSKIRMLKSDKGLSKIKFRSHYRELFSFRHQFFKHLCFIFFIGGRNENSGGVVLLTNIFKYAFPQERPGLIRITMQPLADGKLKLAISDNGQGFAMEGQNKSVGSRLIKTFGLQLGGVSQVRSVAGEGTVVELTFPDPDLASPSA